MKTVEKNERFKTCVQNHRNRINTLFKWNAITEGFRMPRNMELLLRDNGSVGWDKVHHVWVTGTFTKATDDYNEFIEYVAKTLSINPKTYHLKNHDEVIVCGNTCEYTRDTNNINWDATMQSETNISMFYQLVNSRNVPIIVANNDKVKMQIDKAFNDICEGKPVVITTDLLSNVEVLNILDPSNIEKMECLTSFDEASLKKVMNLFGGSLDTKDKKAQINNAELHAYDDYTTVSYLAYYEPRLEFVKEMKENGIEIECIRNPIFGDEPDEEEIETGEMPEETIENNEGGELNEEDKTDLPDGEGNE